MAGTTSTVPGVLSALVRMFTIAVPDASVSDGQPTNGADDLIMVGFTGDPAAPAVSMTRETESLSAAGSREQYEVTCIISAWRGATDDVTTVRDRAFEMVNATTAELARDQTLGGLVLSARLSLANVAQYFSEEGVSVDVQATIAVDAFTRTA